MVNINLFLQRKALPKEIEENFLKKKVLSKHFLSKERTCAKKAMKINKKKFNKEEGINISHSSVSDGSACGMGAIEIMSKNKKV